MAVCQTTLVSRCIRPRPSARAAPRPSSAPRHTCPRRSRIGALRLAKFLVVVGCTSRYIICGVSRDVLLRPRQLGFFHMTPPAAVSFFPSRTRAARAGQSPIHGSAIRPLPWYRRMAEISVRGVCIKCGQACKVVVQNERALSVCCGANALEDGGLFIIDAAELLPDTPARSKRG